jgi:cysteine synthase A
MDLLDRIGRTPLVEAEGLFVKLECSNPGGSVKDRIARFILLEARRRGELKPGDTIVEATSGNTGIAMSMVGRQLGHPVIIYMPEHMSVERRRYIEAFGAEVRLTPREQGFEGPIAIRDTFRGRPGYYVPDQFGNPDNARCHQETTGREIVEQLRERGVQRVDAFVAGVGTGGTLMGVGAALRAAFPGLRVVAVEPSESNVMCGRSAGEHQIQGIGDGFIPPIVDMAQVSDVEAVPSDKARRVAEEIRRVHGHCVGMSSGANTAAARRLRDRGLTVVTVWADCSDRYGSMGLGGPDSAEVRCPLRESCAARGAELLAPR